MNGVPPEYRDWFVDHEGKPRPWLRDRSTPEEARWALAFHEAGHAVTALAYGMHLVSTGLITVTTQDGDWATTGRTRVVTNAVSAQHFAIHMAAGERADLHHRSRTGPVTSETVELALSEHDREDAIAFLTARGFLLGRDHTPPGGMSWKSVQYAADFAVTGLWDPIEAVADGIHARNSLTGDEAAALAGMPNPPRLPTDSPKEAS
ncbi:hypothetical protein [Streptomyces sp. NPDC053560]|uniref:hypothetical protein n=1 Tax=Streptomyces sp. NPDC053560 TaxID=3365711 RepID=UPI0037D11D24